MLTTFLNSLFENGRVRVDTNEFTEPADLQNAAEKLRELETFVRTDAPRGLPDLDLDCALRATMLLYKCCQLYVDQSASNADSFNQTMQSFREIGDTQKPSTHYSADIVLRFLPTLWKLTQRVSRSDNLTELLETAGTYWPLSSVGMQLSESQFWHPVLDENSALQQIYIDRIIATQDESRIAEPKVRAGIRRAVGMHESLAPGLLNAINRFEDNSNPQKVSS